MAKTWPQYIGIDPGKKGALCLLSDTGVSFIDWPKDNSASTLSNFFHRLVDVASVGFAVLEKAQAMPKQGVTSMFNYGTNYGIWLMLLADNDIPHTVLTPQAWHKVVPVTKTDGATPKIRAVNVVSRIFPQYVHMVVGPQGGIKDGRADALLMAYAAKEKSK